MYSKILVPLDGSKLSECSLEHLKAIATGCKTSDVILLMVYKKVEDSFPEYVSQQQAIEISKVIEKTEKEARQKAEDYLNRIASGLKKENISAQAVIAKPEMNEGIAEVILDYAKKNKVDLIIMSTHGRSGVSRWAFGSVADKVIRNATIPVLTVTPTGCRKS